MGFEGQHEQYVNLAKTMLDKERFAHSLCVADEAVSLAKLYNEDEEKAFLAGVLHDILKTTPLDEQLQWIEKSAIIFDSIQLASPPIWHGFAAAAFLAEQLKIEEEDILNAVRFHTTGRPGMSTLEKIIYVADMTSADRTYKDVNRVRKKASRSLDGALLYSLVYTIRSLAKKKLPVPVDTMMAYNELCVALQEESR